MNPKAMRLIRPREMRNPRAEMIRQFIADIRAKRTGENVEQGQGEIDNTPLARTIDIKEVLKRSYRPTDWEK